MFVNKNWTNSPKIDYKFPSNSVKLIEIDANFLKRVENFGKQTFEWAEVCENIKDWLQKITNFYQINFSRIT
jgi:hypothetical protein